PKNCGGLGIRDLHAVNLALLGKWRWRIIDRGQGIWRDILLARYGALFPSPHLGGRPNGFTGESLWWKDVSLLGGVNASISYWFSEGVIRKVGNGSATAFWFDPWLGGMPLKDQYHRLFRVSEQGMELVGNMGSWVHGVDDSWVWIHDPTGSYSVKSTYLAITGGEATLEPVSLLSRVWKSWAPSKVIVFS
ncbi:ribonuclease H protein, partial [Trifolium medium]|nr:ribonuclease H protein [Trifolium medium]